MYVRIYVWCVCVCVCVCVGQDQNFLSQLIINPLNISNTLATR